MTQYLALESGVQVEIRGYRILKDGSVLATLAFSWGADAPLTTERQDWPYVEYAVVIDDERPQAARQLELFGAGGGGA